MCRNIKPLNNLAPPATPDEISDAALQYVRKLAGTRKPSKANQAAFDQAVEEITAATERLLDSLVTTAPPRDREELAAKARARYEARVAAGG
ncbi:hypothetical protein CLV30_101453 [Haloactinopolyspora alba]|uniref:DUF2277 domain-containing protein n=1 Tax=Haloactinopolyspora alba TaxID=648780 RepID=A0A2P8EG96_9ACTN|nr:DUF2277 domain-containing protein [Haloactinopolyspora alba]PSL08481.1 hypothetical protein CLV30_101453 [Haloactinopolyspora alba]